VGARLAADSRYGEAMCVELKARFLMEAQRARRHAEAPRHRHLLRAPLPRLRPLLPCDRPARSARGQRAPPLRMAAQGAAGGARCKQLFDPPRREGKV